MLLYRAGKHYLLQVTSFLDEIVYSVLVGDAHDVLLDNRTRIKIGSDIVARGSYQLHTALVGGMIRL